MATTPTSTIVVNAKGTPLDGVNAHFNVLVDGVKVGETTVGTTSKDYTFTANVAPSTAHKVQIQYDNDKYVDASHNRDLIVNKVTINGHAIAPTDSIVSYDKGALDGQNVVAGQAGLWWNGALVINAPASDFPATTTGSTGTTTPTAPTTTAGSSSIVVNASGTAAGGTNAHFNVLVDGVKVGSAYAGTTAKDYTFTTNAATGVGHKVQVQYDNDTTGRDLFVNKLTVNGHAHASTDNIVTYDKGALDGRDVVAGQTAMWWNGSLVFNTPSSDYPAASTGTTTPTPTTPTTPPAPTPTQPSSGYVRPFGPDAPWNVPVAGLAVDPNSAKLASLFYNGASDRPGNFNLNINEGFAVYSTKDATGTYKVDTSYSTNIDGQSIPWNPAWKAPVTSDGKIIVLDEATGREWDLWQVRFDGSTVHATNGSLVPGDYRTYEGGNQPSRGAGIEYLAGLVRPEELAAGKIDHALAITIFNTDGDRYVAPATKLEHPDNPSGGIPEGTRFALKVTDTQIDTWAKTLPSAWQQEGRVIATALRDYGWFITDTSGGAASFEMEDKVSAGAEYTAMGISDAGNMLDGLITQDRIYAIVPSNQY